MTEAWISAIAGRALVEPPEGAEVCLIELDSSEPVRTSLHPAGFASLFPDAVRVPAGTHAFEAVQGELQRRWREDRAATLALLAIDPAIGKSVRGQAVRIVSEWLEDLALRSRVRRILLAMELPTTPDVISATGLFPELLREARERQLEVRAALDGWNEAAFRATLSLDEVDGIRAACVSLGGFEALVSAMATSNHVAFDMWLTRVTAKEPSLSTASSVHLLQDWCRAACRTLEKAAPRVGPLQSVVLDESSGAF